MKRLAAALAVAAVLSGCGSAQQPAPQSNDQAWLKTYCAQGTHWSRHSCQLFYRSEYRGQR